MEILIKTLLCPAGCGAPGRPPHGNIVLTREGFVLPSSKEHHLGDVVEYSCPGKEFSLLGPRRRVCTRDGVWTPELPSCGKTGPGLRVLQTSHSPLDTALYMDLQWVGSSSSLSSRGISFSPTMLSITRSRGPPPFTWPLLSLRLLGAETTASSADRCFLHRECECEIVSCE